MKLFLLLVVISFILVGCNHNPNRAAEVIDRPKTCYAIPQIPDLSDVNVEVNQLTSGEWAITIDDSNFNSLLGNNVLLDAYIENSYNVMKQYETDCKDSLTR
jgi:hypothetical protein